MAKNKGMVAGKAGAKSAAPSAQTFVIKMKFKKETPGAYAYEAVELTEGADFNSVAVGSIYVRKEMAGKKYESAEVTVVLK